jgi:signal transduction histidine kinase
VSTPPESAAPDRARAEDAARDERVAELEGEVAELRASTFARDEFVSIIAHELRNPISPVYLQLQAMTLTVRSDPGAIDAAWLRPRLTSLTERVDRFLAALDRMLDLARLSTGRLELYPEIVRFREIVSQSIEWHLREAAAAGSELRLDIDADLIGHWDRTRVQQICSNLLSNAIRYGGGQPIEIRTRGVGDVAELVVRDHGVGIAADDLPRIFQRFERATSIRGGLGVGLWLVERLCAAMGGTVRVDSRVGAGSTFTVRLPRRPA